MKSLDNKKYYPEIESSVSFPEIEEEILIKWNKEKTFMESLSNRKDSKEYVFYDGPPFANGLPHYGHLLTGFVKDIIPRFQTMMGSKVDRRFGWDCHGLPAEVVCVLNGADIIRTHNVAETKEAITIAQKIS